MYFHKMILISLNVLKYTLLIKYKKNYAHEKLNS